MNTHYRKCLIVGNWKMNMTLSETRAYAEQIKSILPSRKRVEVVLCVPACNLYPAVRSFRDVRLSIGAENCHFEEKGAFTGEISVPMLKELGIRYVILGHSERRAMFGETDESVNKKVHATLRAGIHPIICVGETLAEREAGLTEERIAWQVKAAIAGVGADKIRKCIFAYEPIWAIGTGKSASVEDASRVCNQIRTIIRKTYDARLARATVILYGGSMNETNSAALLAENDIDGGLIGGASLVPEKFVKIVRSAGEDE